MFGVDGRYCVNDLPSSDLDLRSSYDLESLRSPNYKSPRETSSHDHESMASPASSAARPISSSSGTAARRSTLTTTPSAPTRSARSLRVVPTTT